MTKNKLHNMKSGFKVPDNYFNQLEENLLSEISLKEHVSETGFNIPDGYFEMFKVEINEPASKTKVISLFSRKTMWYAASVAAIVILLINIPDFKATDNFAAIDTESMESYMLTNDYDAYELSELFIETKGFEAAILEESITDASLEDYLYDNAELEDINIE